jgi:hypothetical protein
MLHRVETDEIANLASVGFLFTNAVVIGTNRGVNSIAQSKWLPIHGLIAIITVNSYSVIVGGNHRSPMMTWKDRKRSPKLLFIDLSAGAFESPNV